MSKKNLDPRIIRSRRFLRDALIQLIQEKGFDAIKIYDISERAELNRGTFYLHYQDKTDLLLKSVREMLEQLESDIQSPSIPLNKLNRDNILKLLINVFQHFAEHTDFYYVVLCKVDIPSVINEMQRYIEEVALRWMTHIQPDSGRRMVDSSMILKFVSSSCVGVVKWWLEHEQPYTPENMAKQFLDLISLGIFQSIGIELPLSSEI
jgi:AcrR family transcriptional regulator